MGLGPDPEDRSLSLTPLRVITILGLVTVQVALACVWQLVTMVRRGTVFSHAAFRYMDVMIGAIVAAALVWFAVNLMPIAIDVDVDAGRAEDVRGRARGRSSGSRRADTRGSRPDRFMPAPHRELDEQPRADGRRSGRPRRG